MSEFTIILFVSIGFGFGVMILFIVANLGEQYLEIHKVSVLKTTELNDRVKQISATVERLSDRLENLEAIITSKNDN